MFHSLDFGFVTYVYESCVSYMIVFFYVFETKTVYVEIVFLMRGDPGQQSATYRLILVLRPANERRRYKITPSLIGWVQP